MRDLDDAAAYLLLLTSNARGELTALERGLHALRSHGRARLCRCGGVRWEKEERSVYAEVAAARVREAVAHVCGDNLTDRYLHLVEIHAAPSWLWPALGTAMPSLPIVMKLVSLKSGHRLSRSWEAVSVAA
jgi:hypothetical protein